MSDINILSPHLADLIAAGEVVEHPASVIKELLENSFDAGAKNISLALKGGGMSYIRVTDDGLGMLPEDAGLCFMRHATSKLNSERGLEAIGSMGFRGEALAAISAVSRIELITRRRGSDNGTRVVLEGGDILEMTAFGCPEGTTMTVRDLFYNTPARLKFMKSDRAEGAACVNTALRCALGRPEISVRCLRDDREEFFSPGDGKIGSAVYSLLGREAASQLLECSLEDETAAVSGFVGSPNFGHGNRARQFFFCNGRCIKSPLLQSAVEQAYKNTLLTGRYPACAIYLSISPAAVDVNVHPAKTEVKFREERKTFDSVYYAALGALKSESGSAEIALSPSTKAVIAPKKDFYKSMDAGQFRSKFSEGGEKSAPNFPPAQAFKAERAPAIPSYQQSFSLPQAPKGDRVAVHENSSRYVVTRDNPAPEAPPQAVENDFRLVGEAMKTYIIAEQGEALILIDKHAAHERIIFDRLRAQAHEIMSQTLMVPITLSFSGEEIELLENNSELLSRLGFETEPYGAGSVIIRAVPADTAESDAVPLLEEICEKLKKSAKLSPSDVTDEIFHTIACKAAIKAGYCTDVQEQTELVRAVLKGEVKYCPHGRPVSVTLTKKQLDKEFSRIV
ncbi:MAG: DNA mismatch repair endonuclease MutL [Oscillospiraceae bacterium]